MRMSKITTGLAALALVAAPAIAQAQMVPAIAPSSGDEDGIEESSGIILGVLGAAAIVGAIVVASDSNDVELPVSN